MMDLMLLDLKNMVIVCTFSCCLLLSAGKWKLNLFLHLVSGIFLLIPIMNSTIIFQSVICYLFSFTELFGNVMVCEHNWIINYL